MVVVIGVDPGATGALAAIAVTDQTARVLDVLDMPTRIIKKRAAIDPLPIIDWLVGVQGVRMVYVERVSSMPKQGVASVFTFGYGVGLLHGILATLQRPMTTVPPITWTRALGVGSDKGAHRQEAARLYPLDAAWFARSKDHGRADAVLLATYGARQIARGTP